MKVENEIPKSEEIIQVQQEFIRKVAPASIRLVKHNAKFCARAMPNMRMLKNNNELFNMSEAHVEEANLKNNITREGGKSIEYCGAHFYNSNSKDSKFLIPSNGLYADLAEYWSNNLDTTLSKGFISPNIIIPVNSISQLITTISVLDLLSIQLITVKQINRKRSRDCG
jgi:hypothetical protein